LMEEEGIYYFFAYPSSTAQLRFANTSSSAPSMTNGTIAFDPARSAGTIHDWRKAQEVRAGKTTLWDHCFEMPGNHLERSSTTQAAVAAGTVNHALQLAGVNDRLELYDFPGEYAKWFDGVDAGGGSQPGELQKIFPEGARVAALRMQEEAAGALVISGASTVSRLEPGRRFTLSGHPHGNGSYFVTSVRHSARIAGSSLAYSNTFTCIPLGLPYRPPRTTPRPVIAGLQSAVVVGPPGEQAFTDTYGRVKVQFHWDRTGQRDHGSSCWVRVAGLHQGTEPSGASTAQTYREAPRIGDEVLVAFLEGDPDRPVVVGTAYNPSRMPPA
jgi:type VI secretion system secreted protein VgrG